ncbi:MAG TPA: poly-gamma-glutamate synthase PgsB [Myxococcota bacterium]|jgi:poly-gamma-glutamate synthase PgsB/CapB|nr:poly-gamma-glutamate synthase PgsB [Myxococcota bacterium]
MWVIGVLTLGVASYLVVETLLNRRYLRRIPHRIYVNGTRGKSSVTRLIAAALRAGGLRTIAKTTGSSPRFIFPDGSEVLIRRLGQPNIKEQMKVMRWSRRFDLDAAVVECMALQPYTQWISEHRMVRSTIGVCTNVRADHLDVMGPTVADVEKALAGTVPDRAIFVTAERVQNAVLRQACADRGTRFEVVGEDAVAAVTQAELDGFSYIEHPENVALAVRVAGLLGVDRATAIAGMQRAQPDVGVLRLARLDFHGRRILWINAFAANDPDSYRIIWSRVAERFADVERRIMVVNCRQDRPDRSRQLGEMAAGFGNVDLFLLIGTGTEVFARAAAHAGVDVHRVYTMVGERVEKVFERIVAQSGTSAVVLGVGNIKGDGMMLDEYVGNRALPQDKR